MSKVKKFYLLGEDPATSGKFLEVDSSFDLSGLRQAVAGQFSIIEPSGVDFASEEGALLDVSDVIAFDGPVSITVDGLRVRDVPGPEGLPVAGDYYQIFPDHLGNHQRLFDKYGPLIRTDNFGKVVYQTNSPSLAAIFLTESPFFTKLITEEHPLAPLKMKEAGVFIGDTDTEDWRVVHKFLPPALGPKAVGHYAPEMQTTVESAFKVFDTLDERGEAFNVYQYMLKLGAQAVGKLVLGLDFKHFENAEAPLHEMVHLIAQLLALNKKVTTRGSWYASLPFGDPQKLRLTKLRILELLDGTIREAKQGGTEDLDLQEAALKAANFVDYFIRATDAKGQKLPTENLGPALVVATGAGFTTTSSLLSWLIYSMVTYPGVQEKLLQELVDHDFSDDLQITKDYTDKLTYMDKFIKETQRRHNPSYQPGRTARIDCIVPGGYRIPAGRVVIPALHHIHTNPALWDNPTRFDPDRWDGDAVKKMPKAQYIPFAMGGRMCIGYNFALQEVRIFLPKLVWRYKFTKEGTSAIEYDPMFQLIRPENLYVRAHRRVKWPPKTDVLSSASVPDGREEQVEVEVPVETKVVT